MPATTQISVGNSVNLVHAEACSNACYVAIFVFCFCNMLSRWRVDLFHRLQFELMVCHVLLKLVTWHPNHFPVSHVTLQT